MTKTMAILATKTTMMRSKLPVMHAMHSQRYARGVKQYAWQVADDKCDAQPKIRPRSKVIHGASSQ